MVAGMTLWYVPVKQVVRSDEPPESTFTTEIVGNEQLDERAAPKLYKKGVRPGDVLVLMEGTQARSLARVLSIDSRQVQWHPLPLQAGPTLTSSPNLAAVPEHEAIQFRLGIQTVLEDHLRPVPLPIVPSALPEAIILYGPPGTGKTYKLRERGLALLLGDNVEKSEAGRNEQWACLQQEGRLALCTFHQAYTYEDFVEGLRARTTEDHEVEYRVEAGLFKRMAARATLEGLRLKPEDKPSGDDAILRRVATALRSGEPLDFSEARPFVLVIDEINRANIARVLGELITLLESDKRLCGSSELVLNLPASGESFGVPPNLHVVATMNTADRSIALMDVALRRRFTFEEMNPDSEVIEGVLRVKKGKDRVPDELIQFTKELFDTINTRLRYLYDREHQIGHAYFLKVQSLEDLRKVMAHKVLPLIQEYFFGQWEKVAMVVGYSVTGEGLPKNYRTPGGTEPTILTAEKLVETAVLGFNHDEYMDQVAWEVHPAFRANWNPPEDVDRDLWIAMALYEVLSSDSLKVKGGQAKAAESLVAAVRAGDA